MDVRFTEEQQALRDSLRDLLADHSPIAHVRQIAEGPSGVDMDLYRRLLSLGIAELPGLVEFGVAMEECGRTLAPTPLLTTVGTAVPLLSQGSADQLLAAALSGEAVPVRGFHNEVRISSGLATGTIRHVPHAEVATHVVMPTTVHDEAAVAVVARADVKVEPLATMDGTRRLSRAEMDGAPAEVLATGPAAVRLLAKARQSGLVALAHELVGVAAAALNRAVHHAKTREQFGRPIGYYQAVSHRCADMFIALEEARSLAYYAAWAVDAGAADAGAAAAQAKAAAGRTAVSCVQSSIQVHGGTGFTWEHDLHLFLKRAWWGETALESSESLLLEVADAALAMASSGA